MKRDLGRLKSGHFNVLVIGGGINGCAIARDAALRGATVALIEKDDFASGASGKSTKLIHGGIRYLEQLNFKLVYEALRERAILLKTAPHLVRPLEFIIPSYKFDPLFFWKIRAGVFIYDQMARSGNIRSHRVVRRDEACALEPGLASRDFEGGVLYWDAQMDDVRLCLANALSADQAGCCLANKVEVVRLIKKNGKIVGIEAQDKPTGENFSINAEVVVNATGAWSNRIVKLDDPAAPLITRPTKGIHIVYRKLPHTRAVLFSGRKDKRFFFVIPWRGVTLIGTTDTDHTGSGDEVYATSSEIEYLLEEVRRIFPAENIDKHGIITTYAGLRPLVNRQNQVPWHVSREHLIRESSSGLISVVGGKYTTYRHLAEQVVDKALSRLEKRRFKACVTEAVGPFSSVPEEGKGDLRVLIERAVKEEMALSLIDLMARRLQFFAASSFGLKRLEECADIMARLLGWSSAEKESEIRSYQEEVRRNTACFK